MSMKSTSLNHEIAYFYYENIVNSGGNNISVFGCAGDNFEWNKFNLLARKIDPHFFWCQRVAHEVLTPAIPFCAFVSDLLCNYDRNNLPLEDKKLRLLSPSWCPKHGAWSCCWVSDILKTKNEQSPELWIEKVAREIGFFGSSQW